MKYFQIFVLLILFFSNNLQSVSVDELDNYANITQDLSYYIDESNKIDIDSILKMDADHIFEKKIKFIPVNKTSINFGRSNASYWFKFSINKSKRSKLTYLELTYPLFDEVILWIIEGNRISSSMFTGDKLPFISREIKNKNFIFKINSSERDNIYVYFKIKTTSSLVFNSILWTPEKFYEYDHNAQYLYGVYFGIVLIMAFYNLFIFISVKDISYLFYVLFIISFTLIQTALNGYAYEYFWPNSIYWNDKSIPVLMSIAIIFGLLFSKYFLNSSEYSVIWDKAILILVSLCSINIILSFILTYDIVVTFATILAISGSTTFISIGVIALKKGYSPAKFFLLAWSMLGFGTIIRSLRDMGFLPNNIFTENIQQLSSGFEVLFLSFALGDKINLIKKNAYESQLKLTNSFARFVPTQFIHFLNKTDITEIKLGDAIQKEMTILFSDIRSFTTLSENMTPNENFGFINSYMASMGPCIRKYNGFIDKYIGDAIMALFPEMPSDAIDASIEMLEELHTLNLKRKEKGFPIISIGIGIHTGSQMLGIIGEKERLEGTVISDVVNTASRLEGLTKAYSCSLLVSEDVLKNVENPDKYLYRHLDTVKVKGKNQAVHILEILNGNSQRIIDLKLKTKKDFEEGIQLYLKQEFTRAVKNFKRVLKEDPKDKAAALYIDRCSFYLKNGISPDWDGIEKLDFK